MPRYCFDDFVLSPRQRLLLREGTEQPLIPRYFDLLVFLVEHRHEAVHRRDIFESVWGEVSVSDSALSQAIRTIRRVLGDDPREPRFISTVSRHGYRFVFPDVREEEEEDGVAVADAALGHQVVPTSGFSAGSNLPEPAVAEPAAPLWAGAAGGGAVAGLVGGAVGGLLLATIPGSAASFAVVPVLALIGAACGAAGGAGVGAGLSAASARHPSWPAFVLGAAVGGGVVGLAAQWLARWSLAALVGVRLEIGGSLEGVLIGGAAGLGYALSMAGADGARRMPGAMAVLCGLAALILTTSGWPLVGGTIHAIATGSDGSQVALTPLGRLIGETDFGPLSSAIIGTGEGVLFGLGLALGISRSRRSHATITRS